MIPCLRTRLPSLVALALVGIIAPGLATATPDQPPAQAMGRPPGRFPRFPKPIAEMTPEEVHWFWVRRVPLEDKRAFLEHLSPEDRATFVRKRQELAEANREAAERRKEAERLADRTWHGTTVVADGKVPEAVCKALEDRLNAVKDWGSPLRKRTFGPYLRDPRHFHAGWAARVKEAATPRGVTLVGVDAHPVLYLKSRPGTDPDGPRDLASVSNRVREWFRVGGKKAEVAFDHAELAAPLGPPGMVLYVGAPTPKPKP